MPISQDRKYTGTFVRNLLDGAVGKTLFEIDQHGSNQFARTEISNKITGIAGDVIEQSLFGYERDSRQECDIEIDGEHVELKTTGVRIPKSDLKSIKGKNREECNRFLRAKEGISITGVTLEPDIQRDFNTSHFWEKAQNMLFVFYEYNSYEVVPASSYKDFLIIGWSYNKFSDSEKSQLQSDWEIVRDYLNPFYMNYAPEIRREKLEGFTHVLRPNLLLIELVPGYKKKSTGSYQNPRYRLKKTFVDYLVQGYFNKTRHENQFALKETFRSFADLDDKCHHLSELYSGKTLQELKEILNIETDLTTKDFTSLCIIRMFGVTCKKLNQISDFTKAGIIAKTITITPKGSRTEDMKLAKINFGEWADRDVDFENSELFIYFYEHSFLCPVFCENDSKDESKTVFLGFKRFAFDDNFIKEEVKRTWLDSRRLIHQNLLKWEYKYDEAGNPIKNKSGSLKGAPNFPKSSDYEVFLRGGANDSSNEARTEIVNGVRMLPQYFWLKGAFIADKLKSIEYL